jgi:hypothetical protein
VDASLAAFKRKTGIGTARHKNHFSSSAIKLLSDYPEAITLRRTRFTEVSGGVSLANQAGATVIQIKVGTGHVASVVNTITEPGRQQPD